MGNGKEILQRARYNMLGAVALRLAAHPVPETLAEPSIISNPSGPLVSRTRVSAPAAQAVHVQKLKRDKCEETGARTQSTSRFLQPPDFSTAQSHFSGTLRKAVLPASSGQLGQGVGAGRLDDHSRALCRASPKTRALQYG